MKQWRFGMAFLLLGCSSGPDEMADSGGTGGVAAAPDGSAGGAVDVSGWLGLVEIRMKLDGVLREGRGAVVVSTQMGEIFNSLGGSFPDGAAFSVNWGGARTGTLDAQKDGLIMLFLTPDTTTQYGCARSFAGSACSLALTAYGPDKGDRVACTFSGTLQRLMGAGADTISITDGAFDLGQ